MARFDFDQMMVEVKAHIDRLMNETIEHSISQYVHRQQDWSEVTFGPGRRTEGILKHIEAEMQEVRSEPDIPDEWLDIVILALDGAWRTGATAEEIETYLMQKQEKNFYRSWPPPPAEDQPSFHLKGVDDEASS